MISASPVLRVAVPSPLRQLFDYLPPAGLPASDLLPGIRLRVPFGRRDVIGVLVEVARQSELSPAQLKPATTVLDTTPVLTPSLLGLVRWAADYYQHSLGEAVQQALPVLLRKGEPAEALVSGWRLSVRGGGLPAGALRRSPRQAAALAALQAQPVVTEQQLASLGLRREHLRALVDKGLAEACQVPAAAASLQPAAPPGASLTLNPDQAAARAAIEADLGRFRCHLLEGVTGSGKTEVYLQLIESVLARGRQVLVLVPEIGLTPQTLARFQARFAVPIALLHSGLSERERLAAWRAARSGQAPLILGTRSAVFTPCPELGLIIVDEEHDASLKQQDGFRYHARDVAIKRAADSGIPIVLGSATPSLETLHNAISGRYGHQLLRERAANAQPPALRLIDIRNAPLRDGLGAAAIAAIGSTLAANGQVLVFLNRRGFAPTLLCHDCGWIAECHHCDARLTVHAGERRLRCHHCGWQQPLPARCGGCHGPALEFRGPGTERLEGALKELFSDFPVVRIDRDTTQRKGAFDQLLAPVHAGEPAILVGTQMLAKGHLFPADTLVVMVDIDGGLFSADFRGPERMGQLVTQVAGRAGRGDRAGEVLIQTHYPDHPLLTTLVGAGYRPYAEQLLAERQALGLPPFTYLALVRADARELAAAEQALADLRTQLEPGAVEAVGPVPAPMSRRAGMFRAQLLLRASQRASLHRALAAVAPALSALTGGSRVRLSVDIDPIDLS
ncbi:MAG: primosomal protein N' [Spongiibacteraceae bacterium]|jgi:primosomal protein N' (replication factor Y)|nr:primosomal protein N' [Spongiibacteraceae bacterium]